MKIAVLMGAGTDSLVIARMAEVIHGRKNVSLIHFSMGQPGAQAEERVLRARGGVDVRKVDWVRSDGDVFSRDVPGAHRCYIPGRNLGMLALAAAFTRADEVWMGGLAGEDGPTDVDKGRAFLDLAANAIGYGMRDSVPGGVKLRAPLLERGRTGKDSSYGIGESMGLRRKDFEATISCPYCDGANCGKCGACVRRWGSFGERGWWPGPFVTGMLDSREGLKQVSLYLRSESEEKRTDIELYARRAMGDGVVDKIIGEDS